MAIARSAFIATVAFALTWRCASQSLPFSLSRQELQAVLRPVILEQVLEPRALNERRIVLEPLEVALICDRFGLGPQLIDGFGRVVAAAQVRIEPIRVGLRHASAIHVMVARDDEDVGSLDVEELLDARDELLRRTVLLLEVRTRRLAERDVTREKQEIGRKPALVPQPFEVLQQHCNHALRFAHHVGSPEMRVGNMKPRDALRRHRTPYLRRGRTKSSTDRFERPSNTNVGSRARDHVIAWRVATLRVEGENQWPSLEPMSY
jgi:hypothetical protein